MLDLYISQNIQITAKGGIQHKTNIYQIQRFSLIYSETCINQTLQQSYIKS